MAEVLVRYVAEVVGENGERYTPQACGGIADDGLWEGWIEFVAVQGDRRIESGRETTQPSRVTLDYWAQGLTRAYLQGALGRSQSPTEAIRRDRTQRVEHRASLLPPRR